MFTLFFFMNPATTKIYTLSLHDALPIFVLASLLPGEHNNLGCADDRSHLIDDCSRSEEHTSELQSRPHLVCRLLLEKKKTIQTWAFLNGDVHFVRQMA